METYDLVFHYGDVARTVTDVVADLYTFERLLKDVHRLHAMPKHTHGILAVSVVVDVEHPPEKIPVRNDDDVKRMFERNHDLKEVHLYIEAEIATPIAVAYAHEPFPGEEEDFESQEFGEGPSTGFDDLFDDEGVDDVEVPEDTEAVRAKATRRESSSEGVLYSDEETAKRYQNLEEDEALPSESAAEDEGPPTESADEEEAPPSEAAEEEEPPSSEPAEEEEAPPSEPVSGGSDNEDPDFEEADMEGSCNSRGRSDNEDSATDNETVHEKILSRGKDVMSDYESDDGCGMGKSDYSEDDIQSDETADFQRGVQDPMRRFIDNDFYRQPEDHYAPIDFVAGETMFRDVYAARNAVKDFALREGFFLEKIKSDKVRVTMRCKGEGCSWRFHASILPDGITFQLKTFTNRHSCIRTVLNHASAEWLSHKFIPTLKANPEAKTKELRAIAQSCGVTVDYMQLWRARQKAMLKLDGDHEHAFHAVPYYCRVLENYIPNSHIRLQYEQCEGNDDDDAAHIPRTLCFKRMFVGMAPLRDGFLAGCSPLIGLDGCHLKGAFGGIFLSAVSLDGDNGLYPICWAVVEAETRDSWLFFLRNMAQFLGGFAEDKPWTIMTDRQKGLIQAIDEVIPQAINRKCAKHIFQNCAKLFSIKRIKQDFWAAARAYTEVEFWIHMQHIKAQKKNVYDWLMKIEPSLWSRHAFDTRLKNNHITNNFSESFNAWIAPVRHKPIMALLEGLRTAVMTRLQDRFLKAQEWTQPIMPCILRKINNNILLARQCQLSQASPTLFQVSGSTGHNIVDLAQKSCDCRSWEVSGFPCKHACKVIDSLKLDMTVYVDKQFLRSEFLKTYTHVIPPVPSEDKWNHSEMEDVIPTDLRPPELRRLPGRPRVHRRRDANEETPKRSSRGIKCGKCGDIGHNKRTCEGGSVGSGRSRRRRKTFETSGSQTADIADNEPLASYVRRSQTRRTVDADAGEDEGANG